MSDASMVDRFRNEILRAATVVEEFESASQAEAWASGALADWWDIGATSSLAAELDRVSPLAAGVVGYLEGAEPDVAGVPWASDVGRHVLLSAHEVRSSESTDHDEALVLEYEAPSGDRHDVSVTVRNGRLVDASIGPAGLLDATDDGPDGVTTTEAVVGEAVERTTRAIESLIVDELSDGARANLPLLARRLNVELRLASERPDAVALPPRDPEDDAYAASLLVSALRLDVDAATPSVVQEAISTHVAKLEPHDLDSLSEVAGPGLEDIGDDLGSWLRLVGAYLAPASLAPHSIDTQEAMAELEWADWLGAILGVVRAGAGTDIDGETLVSMINRCPEITTSIPKTDTPRLAWAMEQALYSWEVTGVLDEHGRLTDAGVWLLPRAAVAMWRPPT